MIFDRLRRRSQRIARAHRLYQSIVTQSRTPEFYSDLGVPDTLDGRFDMIVLHLALVFRRLRKEGSDGAALAQTVFDVMIDDMDQSLREMGVGDLSVGRRVKEMARAFYGRAAAYDDALASDGDGLEAALRRNLYATADPSTARVAPMAHYVKRLTEVLDDQPGEALLDGVVEFDVPPTTGMT